MRYTLLFCCAFAYLLFSCERMDNNEIKKSWWKYRSGYHLSDGLRFNDNNLKDDTIYSNGKPIAIIVSCGKGMFRDNAILKIEEIQTGEKGTYYQKGTIK